MGVSLSDYKILSKNYVYSWLDAFRSVLKFRVRGEPTDTAVEWLWNQRNERGLWDFGPTAGNYYKLSSDWRKKNRTFDCSVLVLSLLTDYLKH